MLLNQLKKQYGVEVVEIENVDEAINFIFYNATIKKKEFKLEENMLPPSLFEYNASGLEKFKRIAAAMIELENTTVSSLPETTQEFQELKKFLANSIKNQHTLLAKGYLFTAANDAFLNYIDASSFAFVDDIETLKLAKKKNQIIACLNSLR